MEEAAKETVIVVHGTFAAPQPGASRWYQPVAGVPATEGFIAKLNDALQKQGSAARCWAHCRQGDQGFHWSGENSWVARTQAAAELRSYVLNLRNEGWCCHIVAHSHGGNVVLEALPQITTAIPFTASLGKIVTLGTPFMDTMSPIRERIRRTQRFIVGLSMIASIWISLFPQIVRVFGFAGRNVVLVGTITFLAPAIVFALLFFGRKSQTELIFNRAAQLFSRERQPDLSFNRIFNSFNRAAQTQLKFLAIGSLMDEPWQLLHYLRNAPNPMAVNKNLIRYLISSRRSHISVSRQIARIYGANSYRDLNLKAKLVLALMYLLFLLPLLLIAVMIGLGEPILMYVRFAAAEIVIGLLGWFVGGSVLILLSTRKFGTEFYSAFFAPFRWCVYRVVAITGIVQQIVIYVVRSRGWSVVLLIAMGLEGYRHPLPLIEQYPSSVPGVTYENMPTGAEQRARTRRGEWINRHVDSVAQTFSKLVVTSADITLLLDKIEADQTLVHAAYYTDDECIARIADWIAKDGLPSNAAIAAEVRTDA